MLGTPKKDKNMLGKMDLKRFKLILALSLCIQVGCKVRGDFYPILNQVKGKNVKMQKLSKLYPNEEIRVRYLFVDTLLSFDQLRVIINNKPSIKYLEIRNAKPFDFDSLCLLVYHNQNITHLYIENVDSITPSIKYLQQLQWLGINNSFIQKIPNEIGELRNLKTLNLGYLYKHYQNGNEISALPSEFIKLRKLKYLYLSDNKFETFPVVLCSVNKLVYVDLSLNNISVIPDCICNKRINIKISKEKKIHCTCPKNINKH
jgi:hypothetical protein